MRLPRRVPWQDLGELEQVCGWIYADESDFDAKQRAVNRLAAWKVAVPLPHALESAHAILSTILQDGSSANAPSSSSYLSLRMSYAAAIIRLVNGLVDPLQLGAYARSIASIAQQLGLPAWFVELRHAATHEDLPSLEVLRDAARESMTWLLHNYFLPTLNPSTPSAAPSQPLRPLAPLLRQYKALMKATTRDATLRVQLRGDITKATRDVERWIAEAKVASAAAAGALGWEDTLPDGDEEDARERWALDRVAEALVQKGGLVPLSKKKRLSPGQNTLSLPRSSLLIWTPLLSHLQSLHPTLPLRLVSAISAYLAQPVAAPQDDPEIVSLSVVAPTDEPKADPSYDLCLASWAKWLVDSCSNADTEDAEDIREAALVRIVASLGPESAATGGIKPASTFLLQALSAERPQLATALSVLSQQPAQTSTSSADWEESTIDIMDRRLGTLLALSADTQDGGDSGTDVTMDEGAAGAEERPPPGWRKLSTRDGWRPSPIGVYVHCT
ncbi:Las1-domain-containing protein [Trametes versicolor FP-101664 SS1]|uniref:Las1-domain-containing protein n=1 Tax=Trametes versicolor (strain FP-101664) TaxID=717944 RepID=UPI00046249E1|nr:Las1-domain-containing protein [Trametes versicolor FP-101664 SS1]EIW64980.1 Las1-domain-containing protein [Trametes versicolor FP-101664 SS1]